MFDYHLLLLAHLLLFVYWLGGDFGVFYSSFYVVDSKLSPESRLTASRILLAIDQLPRFCLLLMLPVGLSLANRLGIVTLAPVSLAATWLAAALWICLVVALHRLHGRPPSALLTRVDLVARLGVIFTLVYYGARSLLSDAPALPDWLAAKLLVFAAIMFSGLCIRWVFAPFGRAFGLLITEGSSEVVETTIRQSLARSKPFVIAIWIGILAAAWLGLTKPTF